MPFIAGIMLLLKSNVHRVKSVLRDNLSFLIPYAVFLIGGGVFLCSYSRGETHLIINSYHNTFLDYINPYITLLGAGVPSAIAVIILLFVRYRYALITAISFLLAVILTQLLRQTIFHGMPRPVTFFRGIHNLHLVPGVNVHSINTFPSGHTVTAFALFFSLSLCLKNNTIKFLSFIFALLTAYSRVYLSQHFFGDVYISSLIGIFITVITYYFIQKIKKSWPEKSLKTVLTKSSVK